MTTRDIEADMSNYMLGGDDLIFGTRELKASVCTQEHTIIQKHAMKDVHLQLT